MTETSKQWAIGIGASSVDKACQIIPIKLGGRVGSENVFPWNSKVSFGLFDTIGFEFLQVNMQLVLFD